MLARTNFIFLHDSFASSYCKSLSRKPRLGEASSSHRSNPGPDPDILWPAECTDLKLQVCLSQESCTPAISVTSFIIIIMLSQTPPGRAEAMQRAASLSCKVAKLKARCF